MPKGSLKYFMRINGNNRTVFKEATVDEACQYMEYYSVLKNFAYDCERFNIPQRAYDMLISLVNNAQSYTEAMTLTDSNLFTASYLSSFRNYLAICERQFSDYWVDRPDILENFKRFQNEEYDKCMEYKFIYHLRNYSEHYDIPIQNPGFRRNDSGNIVMHINVDRDSLLKYEKWKADEVVFLNNKDRFFNLLPILSTAHESLLRIHTRLLNYRIDEELIRTCRNVLSFKDSMQIDDDHLMLIRFTGANRNEILDIFKFASHQASGMDYWEIPWELCKYIVAKSGDSGKENTI